MIDRIPTGNRVLDALPDDEFSLLSAHLSTVEIPLGAIVYRSNEEMEAVFFPQSAVFSMLAIMQDGAAVETATVGREGCVGAQLFLSPVKALHQTVCQVAGTAVRMPTANFLPALSVAPTFASLLRRVLLGMMATMSQSVACNRLHTLTERCARWLLMTRDRLDCDEFALTQDFLATMLGAHRPSVSLAAASLQQAGFISYRYGRVTVRDREGLESASCECYRVNAEIVDRLLATA